MSFRSHHRILDNLEPFIRQLKPPEQRTKFLECFVVFVHHRWTSTLLSVMLTAALTGWFAQEVAVCVNKFDRSEISVEMQAICLTYPYTEQQVYRENQQTDTVRFYALHYKWVPYTFGLILCVFVGLQLFVNKMEDAKVCELLTKIHCLRSDAERYLTCENYFLDNIGRHGHLPRARSHVLIACIASNCIAFFILNMAIGGFYLHLPVNFFVIREMQNFSDPISVAFPPFIECELAPKMQLWMDRTERIGCYLPLMELYEKMFVGLWLWQAWLLLLAVITVTKTMLLHLSSVQRRMLVLPCRSRLPSRLLASRTSLGDLMLLCHLQPLLSTVNFQRLIETAAATLTGIHDDQQFNIS